MTNDGQMDMRLGVTDVADLSQLIDDRIGEVRTEALDISFGELSNLRSADELVIQPEYQRLFRWSNEQRSRLIESILLELPVPQIFVIENPDGVLELIDGLQRVSSVIQLIDPAVLGLEPLRLSGCDLIPDLNGLTFDELPLSLRLRVKRASVRTIVIKRQSRSFLRYEMFKRLNTGGEALSPQEIRNCSARMLGDEGSRFYSLIQELASNQEFVDCTQTLPQSTLDQKGDEELVLRFFAAKNYESGFKGSVRDWLDDYMEGVLLGKLTFDHDVERVLFLELFAFLSESLGAGAFVKYRSDAPIGALAPAYFEGVAIGTQRELGLATEKGASAVRSAVVSTVQSEAFRDHTGPGANSKEKLARRIGLIREAIVGA